MNPHNPDQLAIRQPDHQYSDAVRRTAGVLAMTAVLSGVAHSPNETRLPDHSADISAAYALDADMLQSPVSLPKAQVNTISPTDTKVAKRSDTTHVFERKDFTTSKSVEPSEVVKQPSKKSSPTTPSTRPKPHVPASKTASTPKTTRSPKPKAANPIAKPVTAPKTPPKPSAPVKPGLPGDGIPNPGGESFLGTYETVKISPEVKKIMQTETVYLEGIGCSGALVRNAENTPVGVATAEHCGFRDQTDKRIKGADGNDYVVKQFRAMTGDSLDKLSPVEGGGFIESAYVNADNDEENDLTLLAFSGHTIDEVRENYNHIENDQIAKLKVGDAIYMSGWPVNQPNRLGAMMRQEFGLNFVGTSVTEVSNKSYASPDRAYSERISVVWAAANKSNQNAICSFGASGSEGFIMMYGKKVPLGPLAAFSDFKGTAFGSAEDGIRSRKYYQEQFQVELGSADAICGFEIRLPDQKISKVLRIVKNISDIPGYSIIDRPPIKGGAPETVEPTPINKGAPEVTDPVEEGKGGVIEDEKPVIEETKPESPEEAYKKEAFYKSAVEQLLDPTTEKIIIDDGFLRLIDPEDPTAPDILTKKSVLIRDPNSFEAILFYEDTSTPDMLGSKHYKDIRDMILVDSDQKSGISMRTGNISVNRFGMQDADGNKIGESELLGNRSLQRFKAEIDANNALIFKELIPAQT